MNPKRGNCSDSESNSCEDVPYRFSVQSESESESSGAEVASPKRDSSTKKYKSRGKCLNKNAVMARQNRMRKKLYLEKLEEEVESLREDNRKLKSITKKDNKTIQKMEQELKYLKSLISKRTDLWKILSSLNSTLKTKSEAVKVERVPQLINNDPPLPLPQENIDEDDPFRGMDFLDNSHRQTSPRDEAERPMHSNSNRDGPWTSLFQINRTLRWRRVKMT